VAQPLGGCMTLVKLPNIASVFAVKTKQNKTKQITFFIGIILYFVRIKWCFIFNILSTVPTNTDRKRIATLTRIHIALVTATIMQNHSISYHKHHSSWYAR
jgi:hypothetical protein